MIPLPVIVVFAIVILIYIGVVLYGILKLDSKLFITLAIVQSTIIIVQCIIAAIAGLIVRYDIFFKFF